MRRTLLMTALISLAALGRQSAFAAQSGSGFPTEAVTIVSDPASLVPQLRRSISLQLSGVSVEQALREIARRANVPITYNDAILPRAASVWLTRDDIRTDEALQLVLQNAGLRVMALSTGQLVVVKAPASEAKRAARATRSLRSSDRGRCHRRCGA